jgi:hypothetical protein
VTRTRRFLPKYPAGIRSGRIDDAPGRSGTIQLLASRRSRTALRDAPVPSAAFGEFDCVAVWVMC